MEISKPLNNTHLKIYVDILLAINDSILSEVLVFPVLLGTLLQVGSLQKVFFCGQSSFRSIQISFLFLLFTNHSIKRCEKVWAFGTVVRTPFEVTI